MDLMNLITILYVSTCSVTWHVLVWHWSQVKLDKKKGDKMTYKYRRNEWQLLEDSMCSFNSSNGRVTIFTVSEKVIRLLNCWNAIFVQQILFQ